MTAYRLGLTREAQQRPALAAEAMAKAIVHHRAAFEHGPEFPDYRHYLSDDYHAMARLQRTLNRQSEAAVAARACLPLWRENPDQLYEVAGELASCLHRSVRQSAPDRAGRLPGTDDRALADEAITILLVSRSASPIRLTSIFVTRILAKTKCLSF